MSDGGSLPRVVFPGPKAPGSRCFRGVSIIGPARELMGRLCRDERGVSAIFLALGLSSILGFAGLGVDVGLWYSDKRTLQGVADLAAWSAAQTYQIEGSSSSAANDAQNAAIAVAAADGLVSGSNGVKVTVNKPPASGSYTTSSGAFEVIVTKAEPLFFSALYLNSVSAGARAVAVSGSAGQYCVLVLNSSNVTTTTLSGNGSLNLTNCGLQVNGSSSSALTLSGNASITASTVSVVGAISTSGGASIHVSESKTTGATAVPDPYADLTVSAPTGCSNANNSFSGGAKATISAGVYCGLSLSGGSTVTMNPGVYYIAGNSAGGLSVSGDSTLTGTGVTIVLTGSGSNYASTSISGGSTISLSAPTTGPTAGIVMYGDRNAPTSTSVQLSGGSTMAFSGLLYFPSETVSYSGNSSSTSCTELIAYDVTFSGASAMSNNCPNIPVEPIGGASTRMVE
jgi:Flp pilus assembly protein TadG